MARRTINRPFWEKLLEGPAYCFTSDLDWAPESMVREMLEIFSERDVPLTPFITNRSDTITERYGGSGARYVGLHPNFMPGSTCGKDFKEVISHMLDLWPEAECFRSHAFVDSSAIANEFYSRGLRYDSNLCLYLQPSLMPLFHGSGLLRFPVFFEDDTHAIQGGGWDLSGLLDLLKTPGLKIFNFHPAHVCLNTPDMEHYETVKDAAREGWEDRVCGGRGVRTLLEELLDFIKEKPGAGAFYLHNLYALLTAPAAAAAGGPAPLSTDSYGSSSATEKARIVRTRYDERDGKKIYATSRDFNLREIEIDFIISGILETADEGRRPVPRILDVGCGNGYTDIRIARALEAEITGVDFSAEMIKGAEHLREEFKDELLRPPVFRVGDVRRLDWPDGHFDIAVSERCLLNLPDRESQHEVIRGIRRVLKSGGVYVMVEGTRDGLRRLNELRSAVGLEAIPDISEENVSSLKFEEKEFFDFLSGYFRVVAKQYFGTYYLISRVVHPLLVAPDPPKFDAKINEIARAVAGRFPGWGNIGHVMGLVLEAV